MLSPAHMSAEVLERERAIPAQRVGEPHEIAGTALFSLRIPRRSITDRCSARTAARGSDEARPGPWTRVWREPEGALPNSLALGYALAATPPALC